MNSTLANDVVDFNENEVRLKFLCGIARKGIAASSRSVAQIEMNSQARRKDRRTPMDMSKFVGAAFLKVEDIKTSGPIRVTIINVWEGRFDKANLAFDDGTQLSCNATNGRSLARAYGMDSEDWIGKQVELTLGEINYKGEPKETILVKPISPPIENKAPPKPDLNDEVPF